MKYFNCLIFLMFCSAAFSQSPSYALGANSSYFDFKKTLVSNDFKNASQLKIGTYLTLGNFGFTNSSWIGSNATLDYSSYGGVGSLGDKNMFIPAWNPGTALVMQLDFVDGTFKGFNHQWNGSSERFDFLDFDQIWQIGSGTTYFLSNVGIGTTSPDSKLTVKGKIHAEEVKVDLSVPGPDYVFKADYELMSLEEIQKFIKENGHLPNIPSAKEMEEDGIELGIMNLRLLEKIEELTLYALKQNSEIKSLNNEITILKDASEEIEALKVRLSNIENKN
ncbi:tail fiber protein [Sediminicola sp. YIK13]|uniref:tail fiber protein n=1 Tax=Sediminicola sp. YIK13 TaxID=1453352 RepID=UPI0007844469|nr:tail fiber protein [Sediminicola sp. YIK13]